MVSITIDNKKISVEENTTILEAAKKEGINIPTLCYLKEINEVASCRMCVVEIENSDRLYAACNTKVSEGMVIHTNTKRVIDARKRNLQLILSEHNDSCPTCARNKNCSLQTLAQELNITDVPFEKKFKDYNWPKDSIIIRDDSKCIKCMRCISVCEKVQTLNIWQLTGTGNHTNIGVKNADEIRKSGCALCGQCVVNCPVGALRARDDTDLILEKIYDKDTITVVQVAPAVRSAWGEDLSLSMQETSEKKMAGVLKKMGFDYVFDTNFSADVTIMEEGSELLEHLKENTDYPMFTSCCPGWIRFVKTQYPEFSPYISTTKSPQQIFGAITKTYFADKIKADKKNIFCVSIMPCTAKKYECNAVDGSQDVDVSITTREFTSLVKRLRINVQNTKECEFDSPLGVSTGAAVIFGVTGGVMEAALRTAYKLVTNEEADADAFKDIRGYEGIRIKELNIKGTVVRAAVVSGLGNARKLLEDIKKKKIKLDFVEVMACPSGCSGGGGQPIKDGCNNAQKRGNELYRLDKQEYKLRKSHENPYVKELYNEFLKEPLSDISYELLHTHQDNWPL